MFGWKSSLQRWGGTLSLRRFVAAAMLLALLPLLAYALLTSWLSYTHAKGWGERDLTEDAQHLARDVDIRLDMARATMEILMGAGAARRGDTIVLRERLEAARAQGVIAGAVIRGPHGATVLAVGEEEGQPAVSAEAAGGHLFQAARWNGRHVLVATMPIRSPDPTLARLDYAVAVDQLPMHRGERLPGPWRLLAVTDGVGRVAWPETTMAPLPIPPGRVAQEITAGLVDPGSVPEWASLAIAFAQAPRSGVLVAIAEPSAEFLGRMPLGAFGTALGLVAAVLASGLIAHAGAARIARAYRTALSGAPAAFQIRDAAELADDLRQQRDMLLRAAGDIGVLECVRTAGGAWPSARVTASANVHALLGLPPQLPMTVEALLRSLPAEFCTAMRGLLAAPAVQGGITTDILAIPLPQGGVRHLSVVALLRAAPEGQDEALVLTLQDVTARMEMEMDLLSRAARLELAAEVAGIGVWERAVDSDSGYAAPRMWEIVGLPPRTDGPLSAYLQVVHPADRARVSARLAEMDAAEHSADGAPNALERQLRYRIIRPDGEVRHVRSARRHIRDDKGITQRVVGVLLDETEAVEAQQALADSEERFRLAVEVAALGVYQRKTRPDGVQRVWNEEMWRMRGLEPRPEPMQLGDALAMVHPDDRVRVAEAMLDRDDVEGRTSFEFRIVRPDGQERILVSRSKRTQTADGDTVSLVAINLDVTERRRAERAIAEREALLRLAVEIAGLGVAIVDADAGTGHWNEQLYRICGLPPAPQRPTDLAVLNLVHPDDRGQIAKAMRVQRAARDDMQAATELRIIRPDGAERILSARSITRSVLGEWCMMTIFQDVTEARLAHRRLAESELRLRLAVEAAELGVWDIDMRCGRTHWSDRMWHIRGQPPQAEGPSRAEMRDMILPEDRVALERFWVACDSAADGEGVSYEYRVKRPDGAIRHVSGLGRVIRDAGGAVVRLVGVSSDISARREAEISLRDAAARLELAVDAGRLGVFEWDSASDYVHWSKRIWEMAGRSRLDPSAPFDRLHLVHPDDREKVPSAWLQRTNGAEAARGEGEFRVVRPDGTIRYLHWQGVPLRDGQGSLVRFTGVVADVTKARAAEQALRAREELFRMAAEAANQGVWELDLDSAVMTWTPLLWKIYGLAPADGAPAREQRIDMIHPEDREDMLALGRELANAPLHGVIRRSYRVLRADGAVRMVEAQAMRLRAMHGQGSRVVGVIRDVTEARELSAQAMVADKLATLGEMAGGIAHELAQPLQALMAAAATVRLSLKEDMEEEPLQAARERLRWIERQASRAGKTIQHLLAFSRGESSEGTTLLSDAIEGAIELVGHVLRHAAIEVAIDVPADLPPVQGGQVEIEQVLVNLLNNARDAIGEREARRIRIQARHLPEAVVLEVCDTGGGIPADRLDRIFLPFYTTKAIGKGTGLGLMVAKRTMQLLGGCISATNIEHGACFLLTFKIEEGALGEE